MLVGIYSVQNLQSYLYFKYNIALGLTTLHKWQPKHKEVKKHAEDNKEFVEGQRFQLCFPDSGVPTEVYFLYSEMTIR